MSDDYSPTVKDAARRLSATGQRVGRIGGLIRDIPGKVAPVPTTKAPDAVSPDSDQVRVIDGHPVAGWIADIVLWVRARGKWKGVVTSGVRTVAEQRAACRGLCGNPNGCPGTCAKPGTSNHQPTKYPGGAVDVTDYVVFGQEAAKYPHGPTIKNDLPLDRVHFSLTGH